MTYEVLECEFTHVDVSVHSLASAELDVEAKMMRWFMWACRQEGHLGEVLITSLPSGMLQGVCGGFKITTTYWLIVN